MGKIVDLGGNEISTDDDSVTIEQDRIERLAIAFNQRVNTMINANETEKSRIRQAANTARAEEVANLAAICSHLFYPDEEDKRTAFLVMSGITIHPNNENEGDSNGNS